MGIFEATTTMVDTKVTILFEDDGTNVVQIDDPPVVIRSVDLTREHRDILQGIREQEMVPSDSFKVLYFDITQNDEVQAWPPDKDPVIAILNDVGPTSDPFPHQDEVLVTNACKDLAELARYGGSEKSQISLAAHILSCRANVLVGYKQAAGNFCFSRLREVGDYLDEYIHGLSANHRPRITGDWSRDAEILWNRFFEVETKLEKAKLGSGPKKKKKKYPVLENWEHFHFTKGKRALLLGGNPRPEHTRRIKSAFGFSDVSWPETSGNGGISRTYAQSRDIASLGGVDIIIFFIQWCATDGQKIVLEGARKGNVPWVTVSRGYGVSRIKHAIEQSRGK